MSRPEPVRLTVRRAEHIPTLMREVRGNLEAGQAVHAFAEHRGACMLGFRLLVEPKSFQIVAAAESFSGRTTVLRDALKLSERALRNALAILERDELDPRRRA